LIGAIMLGGCARCLLGDQRGRADIERATAMVRAFDPTLRAIMLMFKYSLIVNGVWVPDAAALQETAEVLEIAERSGDDLTLACARYVHGRALVVYGGPQREDAFPLLAAAREAALQERFTVVAATFVDLLVAREKSSAGDLDGAIELARPAVEAEYACADIVNLAAATAVLVNALLRRGGPADLREAQTAIDRLAAVPTEPGFVVNDLWLLRMRALEAQARGDDATYRDYRDRYRAMANSLVFEGHIAWALEME
jgi:adenylate cyclase